MKVRFGSATVLLAVAAAFLMVCVLPAGVAAAGSPNLTPGPTYTLWAYGAVRTVDFSGHGADGWSYKGSATYGYSVILNQTNLTTSTFELSVNRTMGALLSVEYCLPNCGSPTETATFNHHAWEATDGWANFTTEGVVWENGGSVAAIALMNSHTTVHGNLTETAVGPLRSLELFASVSAGATVMFSPSLGLLPDDLAGSETWNSTSAFSAEGSYLIGYFYHFVGPTTSTTIGPETESGSVTASGNVTVVGSSGPDPVTFDGVAYQNVSLSVVGPFAVREGFILVPDEVDLFGAGSSTPLSDESGATSVAMTSLYVRPVEGGHLGIGGSEWLYAASSLNPTVTAASSAGPASGVTEVAAGADDVGSTPVQGTPIAVDQALGDQGCLLSGTGCPTASVPRSLGPLIAVALIAVVVVAVVALAGVGQRRRMPPPSYPNAKLYPPGDAATAATIPPPRPVTPPSPPEDDDPLSNLW